MNRFFAVLIAIFFICSPGCGSRVETKSSATEDETPPGVFLRVANADAYRQTIAGHRGKVVLVDFWATWCAPCIEQFPHTVALSQKYRNQDLAVIGVSLNTPDDEPQVREFLAANDSRFENLLSEYDSGVQAIEEFGLPGPIPCYRLYNREGKLSREFSIDPRARQQFTLDDIEAAIEELL